MLAYQDVEAPAPKPTEALIRIEAIGINYIDIYHRSGLYPLQLPFIPGVEAAGIVEQIGDDVTDVKVGDRVAYDAEYAAVPASKLVKVPDGLDLQLAAAVMLQGMTAHYLVTSAYDLQPEDTALIHAAAGGVGLLLTQMAKRIGARVISTVSNHDKARLAKEAGADEVIIYTEQDFEQEVKRLTAGRGVQVVYDSVGRDTFNKSLNSLATRGMLVLFGQSSGPVTPFDPLILSKGSFFLTRPSLAHYAESQNRRSFSPIRGGASPPPTRRQAHNLCHRGDGASGVTRTPDLLIRSQALYPTELRTHLLSQLVYHIRRRPTRWNRVSC